MSESQQGPEICDVNGAKCYCQHLMNWKRWNKYDKVWSSMTSCFKWRFCCCHCCLSSLISNSPPPPLLGRQSCQMSGVCTPGGRREESWSFNFIYNPKLNSSTELSNYPPHLQILRTDRGGKIDDVISHGTWCHLCKKTWGLQST